MIKICGIASIASALLLTVALAHATIIEVEGTAPTQENVMLAREMALQNARDLVQQQLAPPAAPVNLDKQQDTSAPAPKYAHEIVLREWQSGQTYHVLIAFNTEPVNASTAANHRFRKKITIMQFIVDKPEQLDDVDNIANGFPLELSRRLDASGQFLSKQSPYVVAPNTRGPSADAEAIRRTAGLYESQFVVSGEIINAGTADEGGYFGFFKHKKRSLEVEIYIYDGLTGAMIARHRVDVGEKVDTKVDRGMTFGSSTFLATSFGQAVAKAIDASVDLIAWNLDNAPFAAKIIRVTDNAITIDAGGSSLLAVGDNLRAYHLADMSVHGIGPKSSYGPPDAPAGELVVVEVHPEFAVCSAPPKDSLPKLRIGDLVRIESAH